METRILGTGCSAPVTFDPAYQRFSLCTQELGYIFRIDQEQGDLIQEHFGAPTTLGPPKTSVPVKRQGWRTAPAHHLREYPDLGRGDFRAPAFRVRNEALQTFVTKLEYDGHAIQKGKPVLEDFPSTRAADQEATTLILTMIDRTASLRVKLFYTIYHHYPVLVRSTSFERTSDTANLVVTKAASFSLDLSPSDRHVISLPGDWAGEMQRARTPISQGLHAFQSRNGFSSHQFNPFLGIVDETTDEVHGTAFGFALMWSGAWLGEVEASTYGLTRLTMGVNPDQFEWNLDQGPLQVPECIAVYSGSGLGGMSRSFHSFLKKHVSGSPWKDKHRPTIINSWEPLYFDLSTEALAELGSTASKFQVETLLVDDGWFGSTKYPRDNDHQALGDWQINEAKLPGGLGSLANELQKSGISLGLWIEPEMVNAKSELFEQHPDWVHAAPGYPKSESRHQLVLDLSKLEVQNWVIDTFTELLKNPYIKMIKLDHNRGLHEYAGFSSPFSHIKGVYRVIKSLTERFQDRILFENCASGGGRFDLALLAYFPQTWISDNTDALDRLQIQFGASLIHPFSSMSGHVSTVPNHQNGRVTPFEFRVHVAAMCGGFGYEMDLATLSSEEAVTLQRLLPLIKKVKPIVQHGHAYRLAWPQDGNWPAIQFIGLDGAEVVLFAFQIRSTVTGRPPALRLQGLDAESEYHLSDGTHTTGRQLLAQGIILRFGKKDYDSQVVIFTRVQ